MADHINAEWVTRRKPTRGLRADLECADALFVERIVNGRQPDFCTCGSPDCTFWRWVPWPTPPVVSCSEPFIPPPGFDF